MLIPHEHHRVQVLKALTPSELASWKLQSQNGQLPEHLELNYHTQGSTLLTHKSMVLQCDLCQSHRSIRLRLGERHSMRYDPSASFQTFKIYRLSAKAWDVSSMVENDCSFKNAETEAGEL